MDIIYKHHFELTSQERDVFAVHQLFKGIELPVSSFIVTAPYGYNTLVINADHPHRERIAELTREALSCLHWDDVTDTGRQCFDTEEELYQLIEKQEHTFHIWTECILKVWKERQKQIHRQEAETFFKSTRDHEELEYIDGDMLYTAFDTFKGLEDTPQINLHYRTCKALEDVWLMGWIAAKEGRTNIPE